MKKVNGVLEMLGKSKVGRDGTSYSVVEIGDHALSTIYVPNGLASFLEKGVGSPIEIWLDDHELRGVRFENGKSYIANPKATWNAFYITVVFGLITLPFLIGLLILIPAMDTYRKLKEHNAIIKMLPDAIPV